MKRLFAVSAFFLAIFLVVEMTYRVYVTGPVALNPWRSNSMNTLMRSEFVQLSEFPDVYYELKPGMDGWFRQARLRTNSAGLADKEYSRVKPDDTFRVAVVGSSWTMASGVETDQAWHAVMERQLNARESPPQIELLNFGVEQYGLRELVGTVRHKVAEWHPDLIVVAVTNFTTSFIWEEVDPNQALPPRAYPFFHSYVYRALAGRMGWPVDQPGDDRPRLTSGQVELRISQLQRAVRELGALSDASDVPIVVVMLGFISLGPEVGKVMTEEGERFGVRVIFADEIFPTAGKERTSLQISAFDRHPNAAGHELIAAFVGAELMREKLLPE